MPLTLGLSDAGLIVPRAADYLTEIRDQFESLTGLTVDWDTDLLLGQLTAIMAQLLGEQAEVLQGIYDAFDAAAATGVQASNIAALNGVERIAATKGQVTLTCTGDEGTALALGRVVEGGGTDGSARWVTTEDAVIPASGTVDVLAEAEETGRVTAAAGVIDTIVTPVPGWDAVTNASAASPGRAAETDPELRVRRLQSIQATADVAVGALRAKLLALSFVEAAVVLDNPDNDDKLVEGVMLDAHSYRAIIVPDTLTTDQEDTILQLLYANTSLTSRSSGTDVSGTVIGADGVGYTVAFDYGTDLVVNFAVTLTMVTGYSKADAGAALEALVDDYLDTLSIGTELLQLQLAALAATVPGIRVFAVLLNGSVNVTPTAIQRCVKGTWTVS